GSGGKKRRHTPEGRACAVRTFRKGGGNPKARWVFLALSVRLATLGGAGIALAHEAVELLAVAGLVKIGEILLESLAFLFEPAALVLEALQLLGAVVIEGCVAGGLVVMPGAAMAAAFGLESALLALEPGF